MGLSQGNQQLKPAVRCGHVNRFMLKITENLFFFSKYLECLEYFLWQNTAVSVGMLSILYIIFFQVLKYFRRTKWKMVLLKCLKYLEKGGILIRGISFIVAEWKMKKLARTQALGNFY